MKTGQSMVMGIASLDTGVFGGILVGLLVAKLHNKYYNIQLPPVLGIFSGTKFVPMISLLACSALGLVMSVVWPCYRRRWVPWVRSFTTPAWLAV